MTLVAVKPGGWGFEEKLTSAQMSALQALIVRAIDGAEGGVYGLLQDLVLNGPGELVVHTKLVITTDQSVEPGATLQVTGTLQVSGTLTLSGTQTVTGNVNVPTGGQVNIQSGGFLDIENLGKLRVRSGGDVDVEDGGEVHVKQNGRILIEANGDLDVDGDVDLSSTGRINLANGAKILCSDTAEIRLDDAEDLTINNASVVFRLALVPVFKGSSWTAEDRGTFLITSLSPATQIMIPLQLRPGDVLTTLRATIDGGTAGGNPHGANAPTDVCVMELVKVNTDGAITVLQSVTDPLGPPNTAGNGAAYDDPHSITMSGGLLPYTMTEDAHYVRILSEGIAGGANNTTRLCSIDGTLLAKAYRGPSEIH